MKKYFIFTSLIVANFYMSLFSAQQQKLLIHHAAESGDLNALRIALEERHEKIDSIDEHGMRPLHIAVLRNNASIIKQLLKRGAPVNQPDGSAFGYTPLHLAAEERNLPILQFLIQHGARPDIADGRGKTVLQRAQEMQWNVALTYLQVYRKASVAAAAAVAPSQARLSFDDIMSNFEEECPRQNTAPACAEVKQEQNSRQHALVELQRLAQEMQPHATNIFATLAQLDLYNDERITRQGYVNQWDNLFNNHAAVNAVSDNIREISRFLGIHHCFQPGIVALDDKQRAINGDKNLRFANLRGANLTGVDLSRADLFGADLSGATLNRTVLDGVRMYYTNLQGATIEDCELSHAEILCANCTNCHWTNVTVNHSNLFKLQLDGAVMQGVTVNNSVIGYAEGKNSQWIDCAFQENFLALWNLPHANISRIRFFHNILHRLSFTNSVFDTAVFNNNLLFQYNNMRSQLTNIMINGSFLFNVNFAHTIIENFKIAEPPAVSLDILLPINQDNNQDNEIRGEIEYLGIWADFNIPHKRVFGMDVNFESASLTKAQFIGIGSDLVWQDLPNNYGYYTYWRGRRAYLHYMSKCHPVILLVTAAANVEQKLKGIPLSLLKCNFKLALLNACYLKNVTLMERSPDAYNIGDGQGCILDDCYLFDENIISLLLRKKVMVNGKINPEFANFWGSERVQDSFAGMVARTAIQAAVQAAVGSTCSIQ